MSNQPHNLEAERVVIASCLLEASVFDDVSQIIGADDFYREHHKVIFTALAELASEGPEFTEIELCEKLKAKGRLEEIGGVEAIYAIQDQVETAVQAVSSAKVVRDKSRLRQIIRASRLAIERSERDEPPEDVQVSLENELIRLAQTSDEDSRISDATLEVFGELERMNAGEMPAVGFRFGVDGIDSRLPDGLLPGTVTVLSAPTSCGKSQLALNLVLRNAIQNSLKAGYFSYEMPAKQLARRMLQTSSGVNLGLFRDMRADAGDIQKVTEARDKLSQTTILTNHNHRTSDGMASLTRQWRRKHGIEMIVVDYLQLMDAPNNKMSSVDSVAYNSRRIKTLAMDLNVPVVVLSQVNREAVKRLAFKPEGGLLVHDLIGGSAIECDADNVFIFWPKEGDPEASRMREEDYRPYMQLRGQWAKFREGTRGERFDFKFVEESGRFR